MLSVVVDYLFVTYFSVEGQLENPTRAIKVEKLVLNICLGESDDRLVRVVKVLQQLTEQSLVSFKATKTIRSLVVRRNEKIAVPVTVRGEKAEELLEKGFKVKELEFRALLLVPLDNVAEDSCKDSTFADLIVQVQFMGEEKKFIVHTRMKDTAGAYLGMKVNDADGTVKHFSGEGQRNFRALLFVGQTKDKDQWSNTDARVERIVENIIDDHVLRVTDNVVEGVKRSAQERVQSYTVEQSVDVPDPLIQEEIVEVIPITRQNQPPGRIRDEIVEKKDDYEKFYEQFVKCMKLGIRENTVDDFEFADLLRSNNSRLEDENINWKEYVDRMKEKLNDIYKTRKKRNNIKLYTRRAFTMDDCDELISEWLNFVKCVVDSGDIPMNISGETLRQNKILRVAKKKLVKKCLEIFAECVEWKDDCEKFYEQCGSCLKLETREGSTIRAKIVGLLRLNASMSGGEQVSLKECASCETEE